MALRIPAVEALAPEQALFYGFTRGVTVQVNGFVRVIAGAVQDVTELPPTESDDETYAVWGPHTAALSPATWRVRVDVVEADHYRYVVEAWRRGETEEAARTVLAGAHTESEGAASGSWTYDMTIAHELEPIAHDSTGRVSVAYALGETRWLEVHFDEVQSRNDPNVTSTLYRYTEAADRAGALDYIANLDIHADDDPELDRRELLQVRSRWLGDGPGRADVIATHGDLPEGLAAELAECWDDAFGRSYLRLAWADFEQLEGDPAACPYSDVERPVFDGFDADAFADADLVAALPTPADLDVEPTAVSDPVDEPATYYQLGQDVGRGITRPVENVLALLGQITLNPPTDCEPLRCVWGPYTDWEKGTSFQLTVERDDDADGYAFEALAWRFGDPPEARRRWLRGGFEPGAAADEGRGWFDLDFNVTADLDPAEPTRGELRAEFARMGGERQLAVRLEGIADGDTDAPAHGRYFIGADPSGGLLELRFPIEVGNGDATETVEGTIRWRSDGAGVANIRALDGDLGERVALAVECWDERAAQTHVRWLEQAASDEERPEALPEACIFEDWLEPVTAPLADEG